MKSARGQLILLGLLCQGLSWDDYLLPAVYALAWVAFTRFRPRPRWPQLLEALIIVAGGAFGFLMGTLPGKTVHFFIGHGLAWLQLAWLGCTLVTRERVITVLVALFHLGVACTFVFDLRFVLILGAAIILVPRSMLELAAESFAATLPVSSHPPGRATPVTGRPRPPLHWTVYGAVAAVTITVFLFFPRVFLRAPLGAARGSNPEQGTMLDSVLDPARSAFAQSRRVLFHVEGDRLGYLRCFSLTEFNGQEWSAPTNRPLTHVNRVPPSQLPHYLHRQVRVKNAAFLGRVLPSDGRVVFLYGNFFGRPLQNAHGGLEADSMWNTSNNRYDYWIDPESGLVPLPRRLARDYTQHPPASDRLHQWLEVTLTGLTNSVAQAKRLEGILRDQFTYELGAPELNRLNPTEDFLFREKRGHCERFASTLALLLRLQGIPSRVVIGYLPTSRDPFSNGYNIRFKDAHAWTEGYFVDRGWVQFDATPRASLPPDAWSLRDLVADLDFAFSTYVVNFDAPAQSQLVVASLQTLEQAPRWLRRHWSWWVGAAALGLLVAALRLRFQPRSRTAIRPAGGPGAVIATHYYGQMLRLLARAGFHRQPSLTPLEFMANLREQAFPLLAEVQAVTVPFCASRYGHSNLTPAQRQELDRALARLRLELQPSAKAG